MHTDKDGKSPYLESFQRLQRLKDEHERAKKRTFAFGDGSVSKETASRNVKSEEDLLKRLNDIIYQTFEVTRILDLSRALYGTQGSEKDLCLDMSDFNQSSYNFRNFVRRFTNLDPTTDPEVSDETAAKGVRLKLFEEKLFYVTLPNLNSIRKPCPHEGVRTLFWWLHHCQNVNWIKTLTIPDSTTSPMSDELLSEAVMQKFQIEEFDWRKLDISLDILTESPHAAHFRTITLYSSGNWSTMYHWILSNDGLAKLPNVSTAQVIRPPQRVG
ncbi:hypothetical protein GQ53DRAFT_418121 [Thozetella sp. PMI_491]|nr:hypothetical protein GQ53DRAFT_418121 [Thozetella sp. PMI_491]